MSAQRFIALFRAVNVGGRVLKMADLKTVLAGIGCTDPRTLLQSGNAVFDLEVPRGTRHLRALELRIEQAVDAALKLQSDTFVRTADEWASLIAGNPFEEARTDPAHMVLTVLRETPSGAAMKALQAAIKGRERVHAGDRALYTTYPDGIGDSKLTNVVVERTLGTRGTARNWNTVLKLHGLAIS